MDKINSEVLINNYWKRQLSLKKDAEERAIERFLLSNTRRDRDIVLKRRAEVKQIEEFLKYIDEFKKTIKEVFPGTANSIEESISVKV